MGHSPSAAVLPTNWHAPEQQLLIIITIIVIISIIISSADIMFQMVRLSRRLSRYYHYYYMIGKPKVRGHRSYLDILHIFMMQKAGDSSKKVLKIWHAGRLVLGEHLSEGSVAAAWK